MTNIEQLLERIKALPEIELQELLEEIHGHLDRESLTHLAKSFGSNQDDQIADLEDQLESMTDKKDGYVDDLDSLKSSIQSVIDDWTEDSAIDKHSVQKLID